MFKGNWGLRTNRPKGIRWLPFEAILVCWHRKPKGPSRERALERKSMSFAEALARTDSAPCVRHLGIHFLLLFSWLQNQKGSAAYLLDGCRVRGDAGTRRASSSHQRPCVIIIIMGSWLERMRSQVPTDPFYHKPAAVLSHSDRPFWGQPNSGVDWCEENYLHTHYVAEWWNFLSSVPMVVYGGFGLGCCARFGLERRFWACYIALMLVGLGSCAFHGTLTWYPNPSPNLRWGQALDELPMIYGSTAFFYTVVEADLAETRRPWLPYAEAAYCAAFTLGYFALPRFFAVFILSYACAVALIIHQTHRIYVTYVRHDRSAAGLWQRRLFWTAAICYPAGLLLLWVPENALCPSFPGLFHRLQLHAWFHIVTGISPFSFVLFITYHRTVHVLKRRAKHEVYVLPYVSVG